MALLELFPPGFFPQAIVTGTEHKLRTVQFSQFQRFEVFAARRGRPHATSTPDVAALTRKRSFHEAAGRQTKIAGPRTAAARLLPVDISAEQHIAEALHLVDPLQHGRRA